MLIFYTISCNIEFGFQQSVPPVMAFSYGSLGFLTPFNFTNFREEVTQVLEGQSVHIFLAINKQNEKSIYITLKKCHKHIQKDICSMKEIQI